jgi:hypothetical protein
VKSRRRVISNPARYGGTCDFNLFEQETCHPEPCPVDCAYTWTPYHAPGSDLVCSKPCGGGEQQREMIPIRQPVGTGKPCPPPIQKQPCNTHCCVQDCVVSEWDYSVEACKSQHCREGCGQQVCERTRTVLTPASCGGSACPPLTEHHWCTRPACHAPCIWSEWSSWSPPCEGCESSQEQTREKKLLQGDETCGPSTQVEHRWCDSIPCPVDCVVHDWYIEGLECSVTCGIGYVKRVRDVSVYDDYGGAPCPFLVEYDSCVRPACPRPCVVSDWSAWGPCSGTCQPAHADAPFQIRTRVILVQGEDCSSYTLEETQNCNERCCPVHCEVTDWVVPKDPCGFRDGVQHCGINTLRSTREITVSPTCDGRPCPSLSHEELCDAGPCPRPCEFTPWSAWSPWSATCGPSHRVRTRVLLDALPSDSRICPDVIEEQQNPSPRPCPQDCVWHYGEWGPCNAQGYRRRQVIKEVQAANGGKHCPRCDQERDDCTPPPVEHECWLEECD